MREEGFHTNYKKHGNLNSILIKKSKIEIILYKK